MSELKFHRIFGQGATSTQAFTDQEYNRGWGFLGNEPPPYELFDDFFKNTDLKLKYLYDKQLEGNQSLIDHNSATDAHGELMGNHNSDKTAHRAAFAEHNKSTSAHKPILDAIKAITGTPAFNTAPSKSIVEIINLLGMGGIVAAKLDANAGFVKFANGFTIQWIKTSTQKSNTLQGKNYKFTCNLPLRYRVPLIAIAKDAGDGAVTVSSVLEETLVKAFANQDSLYWDAIALGIT